MSKKDKIIETIEVEDASLLPELLDGKHHVIPIVTGGDEVAEEVEVPEIIPILTLRSSVLFPGAITPITVGRDKSISLVRAVNAEGGILGAVLQRESDVEDPAPDDMYKVGTAARIIKILEMPNGNLTVILNGLEKIEIREYITTEPYFRARVTALRDTTPDLKSIEFEALVDSIRDVALNIINVSPSMPKEAAFAIKNIDSKRGIINFICSNMELTDEDRQSLLEAPGLLARARKLLEILIREQQLAELKNQIQERVKQEIDKQQRDYYLQQQMRTIQDELGDGADADIEKMREEAKKKNWPKEVGETFEKELQKVERLNPAVAEYSVQMTYLQLLLELPWNEVTKDNLDLNCAREQLDRDHFGLEEVKERILEHLAVIKLKGDLKSPILCLYGPPGVGKTSLGKSVAAALGRKFGRISLGGLHDESEIRGHRRTYIGAMPGRIIQTIKRCGSSNPVIILDEVDKVTVSNHGDPSSALLEVLDPEQNTTFHDNYIDMEYDLSKVLFIATANNIANIAPALRDRMEMINIPGYLIEEKVRIALDHLLPKQREAHGIKEQEMTMTPEVVENVIACYTREAGVRSLDKNLAKIARARAKQIAFDEAFAPEISMKDVEKILGNAVKSLNEPNLAAVFIGLILGTLPSLWAEAGAQGRGRGAYLSCAASFLALSAVLLYAQYGAFYTMRPGFLGFLFCGLLWGLSLIVPGMTSSSILMAVGLFTPMAEGFARLDMAVILPWLLGMALIVLTLARVVNWCFQTHYPLFYHAVFGIVLASTVVIIPLHYDGARDVLLCLLAAALGALAAYLSAKLQPKEDA